MKIFLMMALTLTSLSLFANEEHKDKKEEHKAEKEACLKENKALKDKELDACVAKKVEEEKKKEVKK
jgi:hypothetical protein